MQVPYEQWLTATPVLFAVANLLFVWFLYRALPRATTAGGAEVKDVAEYIDDDTVECPACGKTNELGYRFCRNCVNELPVAASFENGPPSPFTCGTL